MPSKNSRKIDLDETYYHVYNRGVNKRDIFMDEADFEAFFGLLKRYLGQEKQKDSSNRLYPSYFEDIELLAVCLVSNHFHILVYQRKAGSMTKLLQSVGTAYTMYFNKKYERVGHLFQERFRASMITSDPYLLHISRYINLNSHNEKWKYSSLPSYIGDKKVDWIKTHRIIRLFEGPQDYQSFLNDYKGYQESLKLIYKSIDI